MLIQPSHNVLDKVVPELLAGLKEPPRDHMMGQGDDVVIVAIGIGVGQGHSKHVQGLAGGEVTETRLRKASKGCNEVVIKEGV